MPLSKIKNNKDQPNKQSSNQAIKYLILVLASIAIIEIFSVILIASSPQAYNQSRSPRLKTIAQKLLKNRQKYYCQTKADCVDGSYCEKTDDGCVSSKWWEKNVGYKYDCLPDPSICKCINNRCEKKEEAATPLNETDINKNDENVISGTGAINKIDIEGGFYGIIDDNGGHYDPINLSQDFQVDGLQVRFSAKILNGMGSIHMWGDLIEIVEIEKIEKATNPSIEAELADKYSCENQTDCVDGSYCEKTDDGCVSSKWWEKNVGYKYDCEPDPTLCKCVNNKCEKNQ